MSNVARLLLVLLAFAVVGCRTGATQPDCNWNDAGGRSLIEDVKRAEDLAIRHADARGLTPGWRAVREECEATLFSAVAQKHHVTMHDIADVRAVLGKRSLDAAVHLRMLLITCALATSVTARLP